MWLLGISLGWTLVSVLSGYRFSLGVGKWIVGLFVALIGVAEGQWIFREIRRIHWGTF